MTNFTQEQLEAARAAKSPEKLMAMAKDAGVELTREQAEGFLSPPIGEISDKELENVTGGGSWDPLLWRAMALDAGYSFALIRDCPDCHAINSHAFNYNEIYSMYSRRYVKLTDPSGKLYWNKYYDVKCFNCGSLYALYEGFDDLHNFRHY